MTNLPLHLIVGQVVAFMHPEGVRHRADVVGHEVILLKLVIQVWNLVVSLPVDKASLICLINVASLSEQPCPKLDSNDAKDEEDEKAEKKDITEHGQGVQQ